MRSAFRLLWFSPDVFSDSPLSLTEGIALEVALEQIRLFLYQQIHEEFGKPDLTAEDREALGGLTPFQVDAIADELYSRDDLLGRYIRWALLYTRNRYELAEELDQLHGKVGQKSRIVLMTPAIVDFSKWLEDEDQLSIEEQVDVMARIACRRDGPRVHGFVGFDPLRQALYDHHQRKPTDKDPMAVVRGAIEVDRILDATSTKTTGGFVGVKLYPPMGFRAPPLNSLANPTVSARPTVCTHAEGFLAFFAPPLCPIAGSSGKRVYGLPKGKMVIAGRDAGRQ